jgi:hypothetical protein
MVHAEVCTGNRVIRTAPAVDAYSSPFEPVLFITDAPGLIVERLDSIWDAEELQTALGRPAFDRWPGTFVRGSTFQPRAAMALRSDHEGPTTCMPFRFGESWCASAGHLLLPLTQKSTTKR